MVFINSLLFSRWIFGEAAWSEGGTQFDEEKKKEKNKNEYSIAVS
jgi:hypothetical protein